MSSNSTTPTNGEKILRDFSKRIYCALAKVLTWDKENLHIELKKQGFTGVDAEDAIDYWRSCKDPHKSKEKNSASVLQLNQKLWQIEGVTPGISFCCSRLHSIQKLSDIINNVDWLHGGQIIVQAPPGTGKTAFITLFQESSGFNIISASMLSITKTGMPFEDALRLKLKINNSQLKTELNPTKSFWEIVDDSDIWKNPGKVLLLIDDAQVIIGQEFASDFFENLKARQNFAKNKSPLVASIFFSIYNVETAEEAIKAIGEKPSALKGNWVQQLYQPDLLQWHQDDSDDFFADFNENNGLDITIAPNVCQIIHSKCDGHAGYITAITLGIHAFCKDEGVTDFNYSHWLEYLRTSFVSNVMSLRSSSLIRDLLVSSKLREASDLCQEMLLQTSMLVDPSNSSIQLLTRLGLVVKATKNRYEFSSQVIRTLVLRYLVSSSIAPPKNLLFQEPLSLLLFCLPLVKQNAIQNCLSKTTQAGVDCNKEDVWVSHIFAAASAVLPSNCFIDPQYTTEVSDKKREKRPEEKGKETEENIKKQKNHGEVDIIVHNGERYFIQFLISESLPKNPTGYRATVEDDLLEHLARFSAVGQYRSIIENPSAVVNVTQHDPPPSIKIPQNHTTAQLFHFVVDEKFHAPKLIWQDQYGDHCIEFTMGCPVSYNPHTKVVTKLPFGELAHLDDMDCN